MATNDMWNDLKDKVVLVTGASSGIGRGLCVNLAKAGCFIIPAARRADRLKSLCDEINSVKSSSSSSSSSAAVRAIAVEIDVSAKGPVIEESVKKAWSAFGRIDALVNNAGIRGGVYTALDWPEEEWHEILNINLTGLWLVSKYVCNRMKAAKIQGSVINISSTGAQRGQVPGGSGYSASKIGVNVLTKVMAVELGEYNIRVNDIAPGLFESEITQDLLKKKWMNKVVHKAVPLRTFGSLDPAMTSLVRYLIHDSSQYVSGNIYIIDCGLTLPGVPIFSAL